MTTAPIVLRVAYRAVLASLAQDFEKGVDHLLSFTPDNPPVHEVKAFRQWLVEHFHFLKRAPKGFKREQEELTRFWKMLELAESSGVMPGVVPKVIGPMWASIRPMVPAFVQNFSSEEGTAKAVVHEKTVDGNRFVNMVGAPDAKFDALIGAVEGVLKGLHGWRSKALEGGVTVVFAGPKDFRGTASGTYRREKDELWVRATPGGRIEQGGSGYGGLAYVLTHELGHRYERHVSIDFDRPEWATSPYSTKDGERFAELFALSNFGLREVHGKSFGPTIDRFNKLMGV